MLSASRKRLILLFSAATSLIVTCVIVVACLFGIRQIQSHELDTFRGHMDTVADKLKSSTFIQASWLSEMEAANHMILSVADSGIPFSFPGSWMRAGDREMLIRQISGLAREDGIDPGEALFRNAGGESPVYTVRSADGKKFLGAVRIIGIRNHSVSLVILQHFPEEQGQVSRLLALFAAAEVLSVSALFLLSRWVVGIALRPAELSQKRQKEFIAAASHELRSPLAVIQASAAALLAERPDPERFVPRIKQECDRMSKLVGDMLLLASSDAGMWSIKMDYFDADTLLIDLYESYEVLCHEKRRRLSLELPDEVLPPVFGDPERVTQILVSLLNNALSYSPEGSTITLRAGMRSRKGHSDSIVFEVADQGEGIADEEKDRIFERFYRADRSRNDKSHFGLGLSIAKELVLLHRGRIHVKDTPGGGATFVVELPVRSASAG